MDLHVAHTSDGPRLEGGSPGDMDVDVANRFLAHLTARSFSPATVRAYAFDMLNFLRFCADRGLTFASVEASNLFDYLDWQSQPVKTGQRGATDGPSWRGCGDDEPAESARCGPCSRTLAIIGERVDSPVPAGRGSSGLRAVRRGLLGHLGPGRPRGGGQLVRAPRRLPESLDPAYVSAFLADLNSYRDRAIVLVMLFGGCGQRRCAACAWPISTWGCVGFGCSARVAGNGWCR